VLAITSLPEPKKQTRYQEYRHSESMDSFGEWLCGRLPEYESRKAYGNSPRDRWGYEYRMYRVDHSFYAYRRDVEGDWAPTKKEAKASYKAALKKHQEVLRAEQRAYA